MEDLAKRGCAAIKEGTEPLRDTALEEYVRSLGDWELFAEHHITKSLAFRDFGSARRFADQAADLAEKEQHHPQICLSWGEVEVTLWTHRIGGLSENDFILAAKINLL